MESVLEEQRRIHEERERLEEAVVKEKMLKKNSVSILCVYFHTEPTEPTIIIICVVLL